MSRIPRRKALEIWTRKNYMELCLSECHRRELSVFKQLGFQMLPERLAVVGEHREPRPACRGGCRRCRAQRPRRARRRPSHVQSSVKQTLAVLLAALTWHL